MDHEQPCTERGHRRRGPTPNLAAGSEQLLATVTATASATASYTDVGGTTTAGSPRRLGDLGAWASVPALKQVREGLGLTFGADPTMSGTVYLYAAGGRTSTTVAPRSYEVATITVSPTTGSHTISAFQKVTNNLVPNGRWQTAMYAVTSAVTTRIAPTDTWIYLGPNTAYLAPPMGPTPSRSRSRSRFRRVRVGRNMDSRREPL